MEIVDWFGRGGVLMWAILAVSVVALAIFLERLFRLRSSKVMPRSFIRDVRAKVRGGDHAAALTMCEEDSSAIARIFTSVLRHRDDTLPIAKEAIEEVGRQQAARLENFVGVLGVSSSIAPLLGLLGTVTGMISVFQRVAETGVGNPLDMASGIWEALVTTAFGLAVGIPTLVAHRFLLSRVDNHVLQLEQEAIELLDLVRADLPADALADGK